MGTSDGLWGLVDGMNDAGLAISLTFGGRRVVGDGFGVPLILRYVLQTCETAEEAGEVLARVPTHMSYNVTVLDAKRNYLTAMMAPDRPRSSPMRRWRPTIKKTWNGSAMRGSPPRSSASGSCCSG